MKLRDMNNDINADEIASHHTQMEQFNGHFVSAKSENFDEYLKVSERKRHLETVFLLLGTVFSGMWPRNSRT